MSGALAGTVTERPPTSGRPWVTPAGLGAASLVLSAVRMAAPSYWLDEAATVSMVDRSTGQLVATLHDVDLVHGLYYLALAPWAAGAGTSEVGLRSASAVALAVAVVGFTLLVREVSGERVARVAGAAAVLLPGISWTGIEARSYAFVVASVVWAVWALFRATSTSRRRWWVLFVGLVVLSVLTNVMALLMVVPYLVVGCSVGRLRATAVGVAVAGVVVLPFVLATRTQVGQVDWIDVGPVELGNHVLLGQLFLGERGHAGAAQLLAGAVLALVVLGLSLAALRAGWRTPAVQAALAWVLVPTLALALPVLAGVQLYQERYLAFAAPGACWLAGSGWAALRLPRRRAALLAAVAVLAAAVPLAAQAGSASKDDDDYRALADLAVGSGSVLSATDEARGIAIAYPDRFVATTDLALAGSWRESATLWGQQRPLPGLTLSGRVAVYVASQPDDADRREAEALVAAAGCRALDRVEWRRWTGTTYDCG